MNMKRLLCICLLLTFALLMLASCGGETPESSALASDPGSLPEISDEVSKNDDSFIETDEFQGETIKVFTAAFNDSYVTEIGDNSNNETCAKALSVAIKERTEAVEAAYGITIEEEIMIDPKRYGGTFLAAVREFGYSGTGDYDILYPCLLDAGTMAAAKPRMAARATPVPPHSRAREFVQTAGDSL